MCIYIYIYVYTCKYICIQTLTPESTASLRTKILDLRGSDSSRTFTSRGGILRPVGNLPESLSQHG